MGDLALWQIGSDGVLSAELDGLRLVVLRPDCDGEAVRFQILRPDGAAVSLIGAGEEGCVAAAMREAERVAQGLSADRAGQLPGTA